ncbi:MAG: GldG family protein [Mariprofundaceae bacterium]
MKRHADPGVPLRRQARLKLCVGIMVAILLVAAARSLPGQWDLTEDKLFTLSDASRSVLERLDEPLLIRAFITPDLPQPYGQLRRYLEDILHAYHDAGRGFVGIEIVDPEADPIVAASLETMGIPRLQLQVIKDDRTEIRQAYLAVVAEYLDKREIIPVVESDVGFEYRLTTIVKNLLGFVRPKIGVAQGMGAMDWESLKNFRALLKNDYELIPVFPGQEAIPVYIKALVVPGSSIPPEPAAHYAMDQFLLSGKGVMVFAANGVIDDARAGVHLLPAAARTHEWLSNYGVAVKPGVVMDVVSGRIALDQRQGLRAFRNMVDYPFMVKVVNTNRAHPVTRGLESILFPFAASLSLSGDAPGDVLMSTSRQAALQPGPDFDLDPLVPLAQRFSGLVGQQEHLALVRQGGFSSAFDSPPAGAPSMTDGHTASTEQTRLMVIGSRAMLDNDFIAGENLWFLLNSMDWLTGHEGLISLRSRGVTQRPLPQLSAKARNAWKALWMFGMPGLVVLAGLWRWRVLKRRRSFRPRHAGP